ncbi:MAG: hypothetical protein AABW48_01945 [Nanoarchaeota archaeon]
MYYGEYKVKIGDLEKKLGILGETHLYSDADTRIAKQKIPEYGTVAIEGEEVGKSSHLKYVALAVLPAYLLYSAITKRSFNNENALSIAQRLGKDVVRFEDSTSEHIGLGRKIAFVAVNLLELPLALIDYVRSRKDGDPENPESDAYQKRVSKQWEKLGSRPSLLDRIRGYVAKVHDYSLNMTGRDQVMGEKTKELLETERDNLLVVCGRDHVDGIERYLTKNMQLQVVRVAEVMEGKVVMSRFTFKVPKRDSSSVDQE